MTSPPMRRLAMCLIVLPLLLETAVFGQDAPQAASTPAVVLDQFGLWRMHETLKAPLGRNAAGAAEPLLTGAAWVDRETAEPPQDWRTTEFDDRSWLRGPVRLAAPTPWLSRLCLRGKFRVTDPAKVRDLKLTLDYRGGVIVCVNGQEVRRSHVATGEAHMAEDYPAETFLTKDGKQLTYEAANREVRPQDPQRKLINRSLGELEIPSALLRRGVNVLTIEVLRSPYPMVVTDSRQPKERFWNFAWDVCRVLRLSLTAASGDGLVPNVSPPDGFQVWNSNLLASDHHLDYGDPNETLGPVEIVAARNGLFSGKVVVGDSRHICGLTATAGDLKGPGGTIPATQVRVRYGLPWGNDDITVYYAPYPYATPATLLGCLADRPPAEIPLYQKKELQRGPTPADVPPIVAGAVVPLWVTVAVPKDAKPSVYKGTLIIRADGREPVNVPLVVNVADWTLPDPQDYRTQVEIIQSPDTLAAEYGAPLWSERHWELIAESFRLLSVSGSRMLYVPLIAETNFGHGETMVRWVQNADGQFEYDFSIMERYLDVAEKNLGRPKTVVFYVWDVYMLSKGEGGGRAGFADQWQKQREQAGKGGVFGKGPVVTVLDRATGKTASTQAPAYGDARSRGQWGPLFAQLRERMARRGLEKAMMFGMITDVWPPKDDVAALAEMSPGTPWAIHSHMGGGPTVHNLAPVGYQIRVWGINAPGDRSLMGWKLPVMLNRYFRQVGFNQYPSSTYRYMCEFAVCGNQRGVGRLGGEFWDVFKDKNGQRKGRIYVAYPQSNWRNLDIYVSLLAPAPDGPAATHHYVHLVEGVQATEARIVVEQAVSEPALRSQLGDDLAQRCEAALDARMRLAQRMFCTLTNRLDGSPAGLSSTGGPGVAPHIWNIGSGWERRDAEIFSLAGEVERKLAGR